MGELKKQISRKPRPLCGLEKGNIGVVESGLGMVYSVILLAQFYGVGNNGSRQTGSDLFDSEGFSEGLLHMVLSV